MVVVPRGSETAGVVWCVQLCLVFSSMVYPILLYSFSSFVGELHAEVSPTKQLGGVCQVSCYRTGCLHFNYKLSRLISKKYGVKDYNGHD